jgi:hypothetical protein
MCPVQVMHPDALGGGASRRVDEPTPRDAGLPAVCVTHLKTLVGRLRSCSGVTFSSEALPG